MLEPEVPKLEAEFLFGFSTEKLKNPVNTEKGYLTVILRNVGEGKFITDGIIAFDVEEKAITKAVELQKIYYEGKQ